MMLTLDAQVGGWSEDQELPIALTPNTPNQVKKPEIIIFWGGIAASGRRVHGFFDPKEMVNSATCCTMLRRKAVKVLKNENLVP